MPTPPAPKITTEEPGLIAAVLIAAPTPVITPQPISAATSSGTSASIGTTADSGTIICSEKVPQPVMPVIFWPLTTKCGVVAIAAMPSQSCDWPRRQGLQRPQAGTKETITESPGLTPLTFAPTSFTIPAPS